MSKCGIRVDTLKLTISLFNLRFYDASILNINFWFLKYSYHTERVRPEGFSGREEGIQWIPILYPPVELDVRTDCPTEAIMINK